MDAVVADEAGEGQRGTACLNQRKREPGFAGSGGTADQHGARADQNRRGVDARLVIGHPRIAGRRTTKRAPSTRGPSCSDDAHAVLGADAAAMRLDDLARDREAKAGVLPEALMRPVGVEALEDALHRLRLDARPVIVDRDLDRVAQPLAR